MSDEQETQRAELTRKAVELAAMAVEYDQKGESGPAILYYRDAGKLLISACGNPENDAKLLRKVKDYLDRADVLEKQVDEGKDQETRPLKVPEALDLDMARFLLMQALELDENDEIEEALNLYGEAIELCLRAKAVTPDTDLQGKLFRVASQALERAETLKGKREQLASMSLPSAPCAESLDVAPVYPSLPVVDVSPPAESTEGEKYTRWELDVLAKTSIINSREFGPFLGSDAQVKFGMTSAFEDRDGLLQLSPKQRLMFKEWIRPSGLVADPALLDEIDPLRIKQTVVTDCSFVSSITVCALYEKRFKKRLVTDVIYPKNRFGKPVYNPCGKYVMRLHINGVPRKVTVDDRLPLGKHNRLLCSYSQNKNEFWVSLLEKAYLKVMGGYDFPGSNSGVDLHALTGWIPDREPIRLGDPTFDQEKLFNKILDRHNKGDVLMTLATGHMTSEREEETGLANCHAYAVLNVVEVERRRLFLLKNPWSSTRWKGKFSDRDLTSWTKELRTKLKYDPKNAQQFDNGVFWIDYASILSAFDVFYLSWRPGMFQFTSCSHDMWSGGVGPAKALFNIGENPQYSLTVSQPGAVVWVFLSRHITDIEDFANNKEFIALIVYKGGSKVYLPYDPPPFIDGDRVNSPHYLVKLLLKPGSETRYTLVVSQYNKSTTIYYTVRAYSTAPFTLKKIENPYRFTKEDKKGHWGPLTAGGCASHRLTYSKNPMYRFDIQSPLDQNRLLVTLKGPKQYSIGFDIVPFALDRVPLSSFPRQTSGVYRSGYTVLELTGVPAGKYNLIPSTFLPGQEGPFFICVSCDHKIDLFKVQT